MANEALVITPAAPRTRQETRPLLALAFLGLGITAIWATAIVMARVGRNPIVVYNGAFAAAFTLYVAAAALMLRRPHAGRGTLALILGLALLPRTALLLSTPALSDDLYRYIWDGKVAAAGIDPYRYAPDAPELATLRGPLWVPINQKAQHTPYPPAAQLVFAATYRVAPDSVKAQQVVATFGDLLAIGALLLLLGRLGLARERVLLYAWSPTPVLHFAHSAHNDALMIAPLLLALALATGNGWPRPASRLGSGLALAFAGLVKIVPLLLAPLLLRRWRPLGATAFAAGLIAGLIPWTRSGLAALTGLGTEAGEAVFNDSLHYLLVRALALIAPDPSAAAGIAAAALLGGGALLLAWRRGRADTDLARGAGFLLGLAILLNAVVEPWYLAWMLPFVALFLRPGERFPFALTPLLGWLWLSAAIQLTDLTYLGPQWARWWPAIRAIEYGPLLALLILAAFRARAIARPASR